MTRLEALRKCRSMWRWLSKHPTRGKKDYLRHIRLPAHRWPKHDCFACQHARASYAGCVNCNKCVLKDYAWPVKCTLADTDYTGWTDNISRAKRVAHAKRLADACTCAIMDLTRSKRPRPKYVPVPD